MENWNSDRLAVCTPSERTEDTDSCDNSVDQIAANTFERATGLVTVATVALAAGGLIGCSDDSGMDCQYIKDCNDPKMPPPRGNEFEQITTPATTQLSSSIEKTGESAFDTGLDVAKGSSLLIAPWIIIALISKGEEKGELSEKFYESLVMAGWGALFLALTENRSEWITPVVLTAFVSAAAAWTPHKKKIIAASEVAALIYMIVAMMD